MSEDGYFGMGKLSFGGLGKVIVSAVETQMAVSGSPVAGTGNVTPTQNGTPPPAMGAATARRPPRSIQTRQSKIDLCDICSPSDPSYYIHVTRPALNAPRWTNG